MEGALVCFGIAPERAGCGRFEHFQHLADGDGACGLADEACAEADEFFVGVDLGLYFGRVDVGEELLEGDAEMAREIREREIGLDDVEDECVGP
jgi:hypothetical protein